MSPWARATRAKLNKWDYIKLKISFTMKEITNRTKDNLLNGRKYL